MLKVSSAVGLVLQVDHGVVGLQEGSSTQRSASQPLSASGWFFALLYFQTILLLLYCEINNMIYDKYIYVYILV